MYLSMADERTAGDPNMDVARVFAEYLSPAPSLPASLADPESRAALVHAIDGELVWLGTHAIVPEDVSVVLGPVLTQEVNILAVTARSAARALEIAERTAALIPEVPDAKTRVNISLRLWSGCMSAAKTIAHETRSGPNTSEGCLRIFAEIIDPIAENDPIYAAGVEAAPAFKRLRKQPHTSLTAYPKTHVLGATIAVVAPGSGSDPDQAILANLSVRS